jgi:hypothetical protein
MALVFPNIPGRVALIPPKDVAGFLPVQIRVAPGPWSSGPAPLFMKAIITGFTVQFQGQQQFLHTLRDFIYVYSFGEGIAAATMSGLAFADTCPQGHAMTGPEQLINYYDEFRLSRHGQAMQFAIGGASGRAFHAYLTGMQVALRAQEQKNLADFSINFHVPPHT